MNWGKLISSKKLSSCQINNICKAFIMSNVKETPIIDIAKKYGVNPSVIYRIYFMYIQILKPLGTGTVSFDGDTKRHYQTESDILTEIEINYDNTVLTGDELEIYNSL